MRARWSLVAVAAVLAASGASGVQPVTAAGCQTDIPMLGDVDGDARADLVVGMPDRAGSTGAVDLRVSRAPSSVLTRAAAGLGTGETGDRFGAAVALADLDGDGCHDLLVGAPGAGGSGRVYLVRGSTSGFSTSGVRTLAGVADGDGFGSAVAVARNRAGTGFDLWVGAPLADAGSTDAGSVHHYAVASSGPDVVLDHVETVSQDSDGVPGASEAGDRFGSQLAASRMGVVVGVPREDIGAAADAGAVTVVRSVDEDAGFDGADGWSQDSPGVPGVAETGDMLGASVSALELYAAAGAPGEDVGRSTDAGLVQVLAPVTPTQLGPGMAYTQDSPGIPGAVEAGDRFGAAVVLHEDRCFDDGVDAAVGAPGEDLTVSGSSRANAGSVTLFTVTSWPDCAATAVSQNTYLAGTPEAGDALGSALGVGPHAEDTDDVNDRVYIGVPGEDVGDTVDAGTVQPASVGSGAYSTRFVVAGAWRTHAGYSGGDTSGLRYGAVFATPAG